MALHIHYLIENLIAAIKAIDISGDKNLRPALIQACEDNPKFKKMLFELLKLKDLS